MAHRLVPEPDCPPLDPSDAIRRLRREFAAVAEDREAGARHIDQMIAPFRRMGMPSEVIEARRGMRGEVIRVVVTDDPASEVAYLAFVTMPGEGLFIGYHSGGHEDDARPLRERCARALGYGIELV
jgi:hypothetical protein